MFRTRKRNPNNARTETIDANQKTPAQKPIAIHLINSTMFSKKCNINLNDPKKVNLKFKFDEIKTAEKKN